MKAKALEMKPTKSYIVNIQYKITPKKDEANIDKIIEFAVGEVASKLGDLFVTEIEEIKKQILSPVKKSN